MQHTMYQPYKFASLENWPACKMLKYSQENLYTLYKQQSNGGSYHLSSQKHENTT